MVAGLTLIFAFGLGFTAHYYDATGGGVITDIFLP